MSAIFPYVGFNYSSSAPCLGGLPILRSPKELSGQGQGIIEEASRPEIDFEQNGLALGSGNNPEQTESSLDTNPVEVAQADTKHDEGIRRLISRIRNNLGRVSVTVALGLALSLSSCAFDEYSKRAQNTGSSQTQGVVSEELYNLLRASDVPDGVNGKNVSMNLLYSTTGPTINPGE